MLGKAPLKCRYVMMRLMGSISTTASCITMASRGALSRTWDQVSDTWEPVSFLLPINTCFMEYVHSHKTKLQVSDLEVLTRVIEAIDD